MEKKRSHEEWLKEKEALHQHALEVKCALREEKDTEKIRYVVICEYHNYDKNGFMLLEQSNAPRSICQA